MAQASGVSLRLDSDRIPLFDGVDALVAQHRSGGLAANRKHFGGKVLLSDTLASARADLYFDPQTSGGLLISVADEAADGLRQALRNRGVDVAAVGRVVERMADGILIHVP
jgi:selenide,water dikinase